MKKFTLLFAFIAFTAITYGQAKKQLSFGIIGVSFEIPVASAITIAPTAYTNLDLNHMTLGVKANYYFDDLIGFSDPWDFYAGANAGFGIALNDSHSSGLDLGLQVGGRWFWSDKWGVYAEIGGGKLGGGAYGVGITMVL